MFSLPNLAIGDEHSAALTITNAGSLAGRYTLSAQADGSEALVSQLHVTVESSGPRGNERVYDGSLYSLHEVALGRFAPGEARTFEFRVTLRSTGSNARDNALQGVAANASFTWAASPVS